MAVLVLIDAFLDGLKKCSRLSFLFRALHTGLGGDGHAGNIGTQGGMAFAGDKDSKIGTVPTLLISRCIIPYVYVCKTSPTIQANQCKHKTEM